MNIRDVATARLREYENNPRNNDLAVEKVKYSIERFGFLFPVIIDMNYVIVAGHTRVRACRELGIQSVPCIIADELTEEQINLFRLVDNKSGEYSDWDFEKLKEELSLVDLTLEKNQLLLDRFELSAEVFDIEPEQAEIKIPTLNFMGSERKREEKKPTVQTVASDDEAQFDQIGGNDQIKSSDDQIEPAAEAPADPTWKTAYMADEYGVPTAPAQDTAEASVSSTRAVTAEDNAEAPAANTKRATAPTLIQFRFGDVAFFISQPELDMLNKKYAEYIDSGAMLESSFAEYLLKGVENRD